MKVFITGGSGFIGQRVVKRMAQAGYELVCLVRPNSNFDGLKQFQIQFVKGDVADRESLISGMKGCQWLINLANLYSFWEPNKRLFKQVNIDGTRNVMEAALEVGIKKVVHVSTVGVYGKPKDCPFTENSQVGPVRFGEYFRTKYEGNQIVWELYKKKNLPLVMVFPAAVLGAGDPKATGQYIERIIHRQLPARVLEDKYFTYVHVDDVAEIILKAAEKENNLGEKYIAGKHQLTFGEINRLVSEISGIKLPILSMPNPLVLPSAMFLTLLADVIKKPPIWGMAVDQMKVMKEEVRADGSKAERELGISYTPIRKAIEETIASLKL